MKSRLKEFVLKRDLVRVPKRFIDHRVAAGLSVPRIVDEKTGNNGFGSYFLARDEAVLAEVIRDARLWIEPNGPYLRGDVVKAARYFLRAIQKQCPLLYDGLVIE